MSGIENVSQQYNANVLLCNSNGNAAVQQRFIKRMLSSQVSGFIIVPVVERSVQNDVELYLTLTRSKVPFVFCNRSLDNINAPIVTSNDYYGSYCATRELIARGYRRIAFISEYKYKTSLDRCQGYMTALMENGLPIDKKLILVSSDKQQMADTYNNLACMLEKGETDAVFCFNDSIAMRVYELVQNAGLRISDDVGIIGYDNTNVCENCRPSLTSVAYKPYEVGKTAAKVLQKLIIREMPATDFNIYMFKPELIVRDSCKGKGL